MAQGTVIRSLGVVGAGQMGSGIALLAALHDVPVILSDVSTMALSRGKDAMAASLQRLIKSGKATADARDATLARVQTTVSLQVCGCGTHTGCPCQHPSQDFQNVDMVVEAASEREEMKHGIFAALDQVCVGEAHPDTPKSTTTTTGNAATCIARQQHQLTFHNPPGCCYTPTATGHRHAFYEPACCDVIGRNHPWHGH